jgi:PAS domain S-box-containing protein
MTQVDENPTTDPQAALTAARLAAIAGASSDAIVNKSLDGTIVGWNAGAEALFGYTAEEMKGASIYRLIPPELHHEEQTILERVGRGEQILRYETTRIRKNGTVVPIELTVTPVRDLSGTIVGASSIKRDLTERHQAAETQARLASIVETSDDAILSKTLDGVVVTWNAGAERTYGYEASEIVGRSIDLLVPQDLKQEERDILRRVARGEHVAHYETRRLHRDGTEIEISLTISPLRDRSGVIIGASSIQRDITERKRNEAALRQAAKMEAIGRLAASLAHDFNNQLHALSGFAGFAGRDPNMGPTARQDLGQIQKAVERMASLTRQLLAFARQQVLAPQTLELNSVLADAHPMLQRLLGADTNLQFVAASHPTWVRVDRAQLVQVLMNLVINARDALTDGGHITVRSGSVDINAGQVWDRLGVLVESGSYAELVVQDTGRGIAPEHLPHIFEPFYTTKQIGRGTGLGLATVEGIVTQSGGHIQVDSAIDRGTSIRILLPITESVDRRQSARATPLTPTRPRAEGRLLVVDDEDLVREVVARALEEEGYQVMRARDGREAIACLEQARPPIDLVIANIVMPRMGGRELGEEMSRRFPFVPLILMSGHLRDHGLPAGAPGADRPFLQKPMSNEQLLQAVEQVLQRQVTA